MYAFVYAILSAAGILAAGVVIVRLYNGKRIGTRKNIFKMVLLLVLSGASAYIGHHQNLCSLKEAYQSAGQIHKTVT